MNQLLPIAMVMMLLLTALSPAVAQEETTGLTVEAGITPDSPFYFIDTFFEKVGNNPEKALQYKEEKLAELKVMAEEKKTDAAIRALMKAQEYGTILEKEVTPAMETTVNEKAAAVEAVLTQAGTNLPELKEQIKEKQEQEQRIILAAEISTKIKQLCETLSKLDAQQYAESCKTDKDAPQWQQRYDQELTAEQQKHAQVFAEKLIQCMETQGKVCDCEGMGVQKWGEVCIAQQELKRNCDAGEEEACKAMIEQGSIDMLDYLPDYLYPVVQGLMGKFNQAQERQYDQFEGKEEYLSRACKEIGISSVKECAAYMKEKYEEFRSGEQFEFDEEMFMEGCIKYELKESCTEKAAMMKKAYVTPRGPPARISEFGRDCHAVKELAEKVRCFEDFYNQAQGKYTMPRPPAPPTPPSTGYPSGMEEWQRSYYERWMNAGTEAERTQIKIEMSAEMERRNQQYKEEYKYEYKNEGNQYKYEYKYEGDQYPVPSTAPTGRPREEPPNIKTKIEGNVAEVKVSRDGYMKYEFTIPYTTHEQLVSEVARRLGLTKDEVEKKLEIEFEEVEDTAEEREDIGESDDEEIEERDDEDEDEGSDRGSAENQRSDVNSSTDITTS